MKHRARGISQKIRLDIFCGFSGTCMSRQSLLKGLQCTIFMEGSSKHLPTEESKTWLCPEGHG